MALGSLHSKKLFSYKHFCVSSSTKLQRSEIGRQDAIYERMTIKSEEIEKFIRDARASFKNNGAR